MAQAKVSSKTPRVATAGAHWGGYTSGGLDGKYPMHWGYVAGTDAAQTLAINAQTILPALTASRNITLPVITEIGVYCGVWWPTGHATNVATLLTGAGNTCIIGGVTIAAASYITGLFVPGEYMEFFAHTSTSWVVVTDKRIPMKAGLRLTTAATTSTAATFVYATAHSGAWTAVWDVGSGTDVTTDKFTARRTSRFNVSVTGQPNTAIADAKYFNAAVELNGTGSVIMVPAAFAAVASNPRASQSVVGYPLTVGDYLRYQFRTEEVDKGLLVQTSPATPYLTVLEVF